jgi:hypothetical protein
MCLFLDKDVSVWVLDLNDIISMGLYEVYVFLLLIVVELIFVTKVMVGRPKRA